MMTLREVLEQLPERLAEIETLKGKQLTSAEAGEWLKQIGEAIKDGSSAKGRIPSFLAHDPSCTEPPPVDELNCSSDGEPPRGSP